MWAADPPSDKPKCKRSDAAATDAVQLGPGYVLIWSARRNGFRALSAWISFGCRCHQDDQVVGIFPTRSAVHGNLVRPCSPEEHVPAPPISEGRFPFAANWLRACR